MELPKFEEVLLSTDRSGKILTVTINREKKLNALNHKVSHELNEAWNFFESTPSLRVAILTGAGKKAFSAGADLEEVSLSGPSRGSSSLMVEGNNGLGGLVNRRTCYKPVIAAVQGVAFGGGFEQALACDIIIASEKAKFGLPEPRVGLAALAGGLHRLPRAIGYHRAMGMILSGKPVSAAEGYRLGFVNEVVPSDQDVMERALHWASSILECSPDAIEASKQAVLLGLQETDPITASEKQNNWTKVKEMLEGENLLEGATAFVSKRPPNWKLKSSI